jgi:hypothetical protein
LHRSVPEDEFLCPRNSKQTSHPTVPHARRVID